MSKSIKSFLNNNIHWKRISRKTLFENSRITLIEDEVELPSGNKVPYLLFGLGTKSVTVICIRDKKVLLQQEYSYPPDKMLYQFPGGKVEANELPIDAARRELIEESKLSPNSIHELGWYYINNRRSDAKMHVMIVEGFKKNNSLIGDSEEDITSRWISVVKFEEMIARGQIVNPHALAAWTMFKSKS